MTRVFRELSFFYPREAPDAEVIRRQILINGGTWVSLPEVASVRLAVPGQPIAADGNDVDPSFVADSIAQGAPADLSLYKILPELGEALIVGERFLEDRNWNPVRSKPPLPEQPKETSSVERDMAEDVPPQGVPRLPTHRTVYSKTEWDAKDEMTLIEYVNKYWGKPGMSPNGQNLWKQAEVNKILPGRTWQAMEGRWKKRIRKSWTEYRDAFREYSGIADFDLA